MRRLQYFLLAISCLLLAVGCARMGSPDGGWYDDDPPVVIGSTPADKATGVSVDNLHGKEYIIVGEPFVKDGHLMVTIFSTDSEREYNVLFQENCIVKED